MNPTDAVKTLLAAGLTESQIADDVGSSQPTINRIKGGQVCTYDLGIALIAKARKVMRTNAYKEQTRAQLPAE